MLDKSMMSKSSKEDVFSQLLDVHDQNSNMKLLLNAVSQGLADFNDMLYVKTHPELLSKCSKIQEILHEAQLELTDIGKVLDGELFNASRNMSKDTEVFLVELNKAFIDEEKDDTIKFTLPELVPACEEVSVPTFWLNKKSVKESPLRGDYVQLRILADKDITAYEYDDNKTRTGKIKIKAESLINSIVNANELMLTSEDESLTREKIR